MVDLDHHNFLVAPICLDGSAWWQSLPDIVLEVLLCHVRSGRCQAVEGWRVILGIKTTDLGAEETSEHSECSSPVLGSCRDVSRQEFDSGVLIATDKTRDLSRRPGFDHDALVACEDKQTDEFLAFFVRNACASLRHM